MHPAARVATRYLIKKASEKSARMPFLMEEPRIESLLGEIQDPMTWAGPYYNHHTFFTLDNGQEVYYAMPKDEDGYRLSVQIGTREPLWLSKGQSSYDKKDVQSFSSPLEVARLAAKHAAVLLGRYGLAEKESPVAKIRHLLHLANG